MHKLRYLIPNLFTAASLTFALFSFHFISQSEFYLAAWLIAVSMFFDGMDGKIARFLHADSQFGAVFDTISDFFAFGIVPAYLAYKSALHQFEVIGIIVCVGYVLSGGFRLIRFMLTKKTKSDKHYFLGLPIPAAAGFVASFVILNHQIWQNIEMREIFLSILVLSSLLMVSKIEYLAIEKKKKLTKEAKFFILLAVISSILSIWFSYFIFVGWILLYIMYGIIRQIILNRKYK
jgi:CDP-diacylglycerol--serine O-phosphatidyltransferase